MNEKACRKSTKNQQKTAQESNQKTWKYSKRSRIRFYL